MDAQGTNAMLRLPDGSIIKGQVENYHFVERAGQVLVCINGVRYLIHSSNIVLIEEGDEENNEEDE